MQLYHQSPPVTISANLKSIQLVNWFVQSCGTNMHTYVTSWKHFWPQFQTTRYRHTHIYIYIHIDTHTHTRTHTHIYIYIHLFIRSLGFHDLDLECALKCAQNKAAMRTHTMAPLRKRSMGSMADLCEITRGWGRVYGLIAGFLVPQVGFSIGHLFILGVPHNGVWEMGVAWICQKQWGDNII